MESQASVAVFDIAQWVFANGVTPSPHYSGIAGERTVDLISKPQQRPGELVAGQRISFDLAQAFAHNGSVIRSEGASLYVATPEPQWAYATEIPRLGSASISGETSVTVEIDCTHGAIGIALLHRDETRFLIEGQVASTEQTITLVTPELDEVKSLVIRNISNRGSSTAIVKRITVGQRVEHKLTPIIIDGGPFEQFGIWSGNVPAGYFADWSGILTRADVWAFNEEYLATYNFDRAESHGIPMTNEGIMDWVPLAESISVSRGIFRMAALGAGWGRWASAGAFLARRIGLDYRLLAVEAEPQHFAWLQRHMAENALNDERTILMHAAAAGQSGYCWFQTGNATAHYGQSIQSFGEDQPSDANMERVEAITLEQILHRISPLDYLHMDIQGAELDLLSAFPVTLDANVKCVNIGTHSAEIEAGLRRLFSGLGWSCRYSIPLGSTQLISVDGKEALIPFEDGVQFWINPKSFNP
jgi:FkbM family methyltransferase